MLVIDKRLFVEDLNMFYIINPIVLMSPQTSKVDYENNSPQLPRIP